MTTATEGLPDTSPLEKVRHLGCAADHAFDVYVERIAEWWPLDTHSVFQEQSLGLAIEPGVGGRIVETGPDGEESVWGTLTDWEPKSRIAHSWHPGHDPAAATNVEVTFTPVRGGGCEVRLVHTGWGRPGVTAPRAGYVAGWDAVLDRYADAFDSTQGRGSSRSSE